MSVLRGTLVLIAGLVMQPSIGEPEFDVDKLQLDVTLLVKEGHAEVAVGITNPTDTPIWANVSIDAPERIQCGGGQTALPVKNRIWVGCPVDDIVADREYPLTVEVYLDEKLSVPAGKREGKGRFTWSDVEWLQAQLKPLVFPLKMEGVVLSNSESPFAAISGAAGTLVVDEQDLKYSNAKKTLAIPAAQIRAVKPKIQRDHWIIVVEYQDGDKRKTAVFQRSYGRGTHEGLDLFMRGLMAVYKPEPAALGQ
jgi:hypothetical protein